MISLLFVDEEPDLCNLIKRFLPRQNFSVDSAGSVKEALILLHQKNYDAIVSDYQMKEIDGITFLKTVRAEFGEIPFIFLMGKGCERVIIDAINNGADYYLQKDGDLQSICAELEHKITRSVEQCRTKKALLESEEKFRQISDLFSDFAYSCKKTPDRSYRIDWMAGPVEKITGYTIDEITAMSCWKFLVIDEDIPVFEKYVTGLSPGESRRCEIRIRRKEGGIVWLASFAQCIPDSVMPGVHRLFGGCQDVTHQKRADINFRDREERFHTMLQHVESVAVQGYGEDGITQYWNTASEHLYGYSADEAIGKNLLDLIIPPEMRTDVEGAIASMARSGKSIPSAELSLMRKDGSRVLVYSSHAIVRIPGRAPELFCIDIDLSDLKQTEEKLRRSEARFRDFFNYAGDAITIHDMHGRFLEVNDEICRRLGLSREELLKMHPGDVDDPEYGERVPERIQELQRTGHVVFETVHRAADGTRIPTEVSSRTIMFNGEPAILSTGRDITERKQAETVLTRINETLLHLGSDYRENITSLTSLCGELLGADSVLYNQIQGGLLSVIGQWNSPPDFPICDIPDEHICSDVIRGDGHGPVVVRNLLTSTYAITDPHVIAYGLMTYLGHPVRYGGVTRGSLCAVYTRDVNPTAEDQKIIGILSTAIALEEERNETLRALAESEGRFRAVFSSQQNGILIIDPVDHRIVDVNPYLINLIGLPKNEIIGKICHTFICPTERGKCPITDLGLCIDNSERVMLTANGRRLLVLKTVARVTLGDRNYLIEDIHDISERKQMEEALRQSNQKLRLLTGLTRHDILNLIMAITLSLELSLESDDLDGIRANIVRAQEAIIRIEAIIGFTREYENFGIASSDWKRVYPIIESARDEITSGTVIIENQVPPSLEIYADPIIRKVFTSLLENAIRHGKTLSYIRVFAIEEGGNLLLVCEDDGAGVAAEEKERIFDHGYGNNTGIGLFVAREILSLTGLSIRECGVPGMGARFEILVPKGEWRSGGATQ